MGASHLTPHPTCSLHSQVDLSRKGEVETARRANLARSRDAPWHPSFASRHGKQALPNLLPQRTIPKSGVPVFGTRSCAKYKEGGGAPISASTGVRPAAATKACGMRRAPASLSRTVRDLKKRRARLAAPHRGIAPKVLPLDSAPGRASWNRRVQTGGPSPAPVQRAPRGPATRRTGRCPGPPEGAVYGRAFGNRSRPVSGVPSRRRPSLGGILIRRHM